MQCPVCGADHDDTTPSCPVCGADLATLAPGTVVADRYEVHALLGRGGMGSVYRAFDRVLDEDVALKVQLAETARSPEAERRFRNEVKLARQVSHPNVCRLHDGGQRGGARWISMELVEGQTLATRLGEGRLGKEEAWNLALQAADGLAAVHRAGIVHRDLKPANLMVDRSGRLRLMDFGIARPVAGGDAGTGGYAQGSPEYMSPEQARGRPADARSDVYSLGVVVFELFTGRVPFRADTPVATLLQHLETPPPLDLLPEDRRPLLGRTLAKDPEERFADGAALADALRATQEGRSLPPPPRIRGPRRRLLAAAGMVGLAVAAVALLTWGTDKGRGMQPPSGTPSALPVAPSPEATAAPSPGSAEVPSQEGASRRRPPTPEPGPTAPRAAASAPSPTPTPELPSPATPPPPKAGTEGPPAQAAPAAARIEEEREEEEAGALLVVVRPWADVSVDGVPRGQTPLKSFPLSPGPHQVLLTHPDYKNYPRRVVIRPGETLRLVVDLTTEGVPRR